jgi:hypothetical protein
MNELHNNQSQQLWQSQPVEGIKMSAEAIRKRAGKFERTILWRNRREYVGALIPAALFAFSFVKTHDILFRIAFGTLIAGLALMVFHLHHKGSARTLPGTLGASTCVQFFRGELERQRDLVANVWPWYLAPLVPGFVLYTAAYGRALPYPVNLGGMALLDGIVAAVFFFIWKLNQRAAGSLQRLIDELYATENSR